MIKGGGQGGLKCKKLLTPSICDTYYLAVPHDHILYQLTLCFWFQNFVNGKELSAVSWTKKFNHMGVKTAC